MENRDYSVSEAVRLIGVESHVLRYWEEELGLAIRRTSLGHRIYSQCDIEVFRRAKALKEQGIQLKAIRLLLDGTPAQSSEEGKTEQSGERAAAASAQGEQTAGETESAPAQKERETVRLEKKENEELVLRSLCELESRGHCREAAKEEYAVRKKSEETSTEEPGTQESAYPEGETQESAYPEGETQESAYPEGETQENAYPEGETQESAYPEDETQECEDQEDGAVCCEVVLDEERETMRRFEMILRELIEEVVEQQNEKLASTLTDMIREELEGLYEQIYREAAREAAAGRTQEKKDRGILAALRRYFHI